MEQLPAELLMSRKLRAKLPIPKHLLKPKSQPVNDVRQRLRVHQLRQKAAYDQGTKQLPSLQPKELVRIRQGGVWNPAVVVEQHKSPRSYIVATSNGTQLRRNRHHLMPTNEPPMIITPPMEPVGEEERCPVISPEYRTFTSSFSSYIPEYRNRGRTRTTTFEKKHKSLKGTFPID
jgi:hypothetical protein